MSSQTDVTPTLGGFKFEHDCARSHRGDDNRRVTGCSPVRGALFAYATGPKLRIPERLIAGKPLAEVVGIVAEHERRYGIKAPEVPTPRQFPARAAKAAW